jgi:putative FmdB family regulatory protein
MPTYSYQCEACQREFEKEQRISEEALRKCPSCGKLKLRRLITSGNFILKGGGWYSDGYGSGGSGSSKKSSGGGSSEGSSSGGSSSSGSSDSKPSSGSGSSDSAAAG